MTGIKRRLYRALATYGPINNCLSPRLNWRYFQYHQTCRRAAGRTGSYLADPGKLNGLRIKGALPSYLAKQCSESISALVERGEGVTIEPVNPTFIGIQRPLQSVSEQLLDIFDSKALNEVLKDYFGCHYRVMWLDCYRTVPAEVRKQAWLWHIDNVPYGLAKVQLLLTDTAVENGAMDLLSHADTKKIRKAGYFGEVVGERKAAIELKSKGVSPVLWTGHAGDVFLFDNNNLHRANPPELGYRDAVTALIAPSHKPWHEIRAHLNIAKFTSKSGGYPADPFQFLVKGDNT
jgi:hypothetical protein